MGATGEERGTLVKPGRERDTLDDEDGRVAAANQKVGALDGGHGSVPGRNMMEEGPRGSGRAHSQDEHQEEELLHRRERK